MQILVGSIVRLHRNENEGRRLAYTLTGREIVSAAALVARSDAALRARPEKHMLFGYRCEDKHDRG